MPSGNLHRKWGKKLLGFESRKIDEIIDKKDHDKGRVDRNLFKVQINEIYKQYGELGVKYYLLHHLLDILYEDLLDILYEVLKEELSPEKFNPELTAKELIVKVFEKTENKLSEHVRNALEEYFPELKSISLSRELSRELLCDLMTDLGKKLEEQWTRFQLRKEFEIKQKLEVEINNLPIDKLYEFDFNSELKRRLELFREELFNKWNKIVQIYKSLCK